MRKEIENFLVERKILKEQLRIWVKDKTIPLEERWEVFFLSELGDARNYYKDFKHFQSREYCEYKHETIDMQYVLDWLEEKPLTPEEIIEFKEDVLEQFIKSFEYDW